MNDPDELPKSLIDDFSYNIGVVNSILTNNVDSDRWRKKVKHYIKSLIDGTINKYIIYAFPASGKSTAVTRWNVGGLVVLDSDDMLVSLEDKYDLDSSWRNSNDIKMKNSIKRDAWWRYIWKNNNHDLHLVVTNMNREMSWMRSQGYTIIGVDVPYDEWLARFNKRRDLIKDVPKQQWIDWKNSTSKDIRGENSMVDVYVEDFDQLNDLLTRRIWSSYAGGRFIARHIDDHKRRMGNFVRWSVMRYIKDKYIGIGDEIESIDMARKAGIRSRHYNLTRSKVITYDEMTQGIDIEGDDKESLGQEKLDAVDFPMIMRTLVPSW